MSSPDFRALCAELTDRLQHAITSVNADSYYGENRDAVDRARAALAEPEGEGPTDGEIEEAAKLIYASMCSAVPDYHCTRDWVERGNSLMQDEARRTARAALARWGHLATQPALAGGLVDLTEKLIAESKPMDPELAAVLTTEARWELYEVSSTPQPTPQPPTPPAPEAGEVAELVAALKTDAECVAAERYDLCNLTADQMHRAATLLQQLSAPALAAEPVAREVHFEFAVVDGDYMQQVGGTAPTYSQALSEGNHYLAQYLQDGPHTLEIRRIEQMPQVGEVGA